MDIVEKKYDHFNSYQIMITIVPCLTDYKYKKDEIFKRMKVTTLVQLVCYQATFYLRKIFFCFLNCIFIIKH